MLDSKAVEGSLKLLCLTEKGGDSFYSTLPPGGSFRVGGSISASIQSGETVRSFHFPWGEALHVIAGRQIATVEGLEVLALNTTSELPQRLSLEDSLKAIEYDGAFPVINWCFGKWWGKRGRLLKSAAVAHDELFAAAAIGDVPLRISSMIDCRILDDLSAHARGGLLYGTDPFPISMDEGSAGSAGSFRICSDEENLDIKLSSREGVTSLLRALSMEAKFFGRRNSALTFLNRQLRIAVS